MDKNADGGTLEPVVLYKKLAWRINKNVDANIVIQAVWITVFSKGEWVDQFWYNLGNLIDH